MSSMGLKRGDLGDSMGQKFRAPSGSGTGAFNRKTSLGMQPIRKPGSRIGLSLGSTTPKKVNIKVTARKQNGF